MTVSSTKNLARLDMILYGRPAGRNIIGYAVEEIQDLRDLVKTLETRNAELEKRVARLIAAGICEVLAETDQNDLRVALGLKLEEQEDD